MTPPRTQLLLVLLAVVLAACLEITTQPGAAPDYQGDWTGPNVKLSLRGSRIVYRKTGGFGATHVDTKFRGLSGNDIIYWKNNRLKVSAPPHRDGAVWKMTVEGVELQRPAYDGPAGSQVH